MTFSIYFGRLLVINSKTIINLCKPFGLLICLMNNKDMKKFKDIKEIIAKHSDELRERFRVKEIGIFGSCIRGEQKKQSDIDVLVEFEEPVSLLGVVRLENFLTDLVGIKVDLVPKRDVRPELKERIYKEVVYL